MIAAVAGIADTRVDEVLHTVGLTEAADRKVGGYSLGMRQRLALAVALLGSPSFLILDEPANGLDPEGISWLRSFLQHQAGQGVTVLVSSHVLSEVQQTVDDVIIIRTGSLVYQGSLKSLSDGGPAEVIVRGPSVDKLKETPGWTVRTGEHGELIVIGVSAAEIGHRAFTEAVELHELREVTPDLEALFLGLTQSEGGAQ